MLEILDSDIDALIETVGLGAPQNKEKMREDIALALGAYESVLKSMKAEPTNKKREKNINQLKTKTASLLKVIESQHENTWRHIALRACEVGKISPLEVLINDTEYHSILDDLSEAKRYIKIFNDILNEYSPYEDTQRTRPKPRQFLIMKELKNIYEYQYPSKTFCYSNPASGGRAPYGPAIRFVKECLKFHGEQIENDEIANIIDYSKKQNSSNTA